jgi:hypothetical protein
MTFGKLAFDEAVLWWDNVQQWCLGAWVEPDHRTQRRVVADAYVELPRGPFWERLAEQETADTPSRKYLKTIKLRRTR